MENRVNSTTLNNSTRDKSNQRLQLRVTSGAMRVIILESNKAGVSPNLMVKMWITEKIHMLETKRLRRLEK